MSTDEPTPKRQRKMAGEGFPKVDKDLEAAAGEYAKAMKKETDAKSAKKQKWNNLVDVMKSKGVSEYRVMIGTTEKLVALDSKDVIRIETIKQSKDSESDSSDE